ncbi:hypothetical protein [Aestuariibacter sp. A3R04]|uniref:hypothetical protein n=1 Tax=Aestuariibacter sp. A3R04 TaxID=2841571 RepID=UPI001C08988D|nr:hypothetical protein [Aestuariibacter sp. A3R04]MBU3023335.1 hypothetical protein [Aestuariibacter sp. A3R04]
MEIQSGFSIIRPEQAPQKKQPERIDARSSEPSSAATEAVEYANSIRSSSSDAVLNSAQKFHQQTGYDQPEGRGRGVVAAYQSLERETQRDNIRQLLGVDIYA